MFRCLMVLFLMLTPPVLELARRAAHAQELDPGAPVDLGTRALLAPDGTVLRIFQGEEPAPSEAVPVEVPEGLAPWAGPVGDPRLRTRSAGGRLEVELVPGWEDRERERFLTAQLERLYRRYAEARTRAVALDGDPTVPQAFVDRLLAEADAAAAEITAARNEVEAVRARTGGR